MVYNKSDFKKHIETIKVNGFKIKSAVQAYLYEQKKNDRLETITISYRSYAPHGFYVDGVSANIYFNDIEEIITKFLEKHQIKNRYGNTTIQKSFVRLNNVDYSKFQLEINNEESFNTVAEEIKKVLDFGVMPFFERYMTLNDVNKSLTVMSEDEISIFLSGIVGIKMPLIKKLVKADDFHKELLVRKEFYDEEVFKYEKYFKDHEKVFYDIFAEDLRKI